VVVSEDTNGHGRPETEEEHDERIHRAIMDEARKHLDPAEEQAWLDSLGEYNPDEPED
jgi:hypothetical protein